VRVLPFNTRFLLRATFAALSIFALLAAALPLNVLSASHFCSMPCCATDDGGCVTGACRDALFKRPRKKAQAEKTTQEEKLCGAQDAHNSHGSNREIKKSSATPKASGSSEHCDSMAADSSEATESAETQTESYSSTDSVSALTASASCPKDCCAGASAYTSSRRVRDVAGPHALGGNLPCASISLARYTHNLPSISSAHLKRLKARAPPVLNSGKQA
jgi:hypothetical protein